jgi:hypothetical protein
VRSAGGRLAVDPQGYPSFGKARWLSWSDMPSFVTIGYGDRAGYDRTDPAIRDAAHRHDEHLRNEGALIGIAGQPVQVRNHGGAGVDISEGAFLRSDLPIAGFAVIEASTLDEAVALTAKTPCAVAHGLVEVWPLQSTP